MIEDCYSLVRYVFGLMVILSLSTLVGCSPSTIIINQPVTLTHLPKRVGARGVITSIPPLDLLSVNIAVSMMPATITIVSGPGKYVTVSPVGNDCHEPSWSPDGKWLAFQCAGSSSGEKFYFLYDDATARLQKINVAFSSADFARFSWSGDGGSAFLAITRSFFMPGYKTGSSSLYSLSVGQNAPPKALSLPWPIIDIWRLGSSNQLLIMASKLDSHDQPMNAFYVLNEQRAYQELKTAYVPDQGVSVSSDGSKIAYASTGDGDIHIVGVGDTSPFDLPHGKNDRLTEPHWSPDNTQLAYSICDSLSCMISIYDLQTQQSSVITSGICRCIRPSWSPNGKFIAYLEPRENALVDGYRLSVFSLDTEATTVILAEKAGGGAISWRP